MNKYQKIYDHLLTKKTEQLRDLRKEFANDQGKLAELDNDFYFYLSGLMDFLEQLMKRGTNE